MFEWPLESGKRWAYTMGAAGVDVLYTTYKVAGSQIVTVPAGTFRAVRIEGRQCYAMQQGKCGDFFVWFASRVKYVIKVAMSGNYWDPLMSRQPWELLSYQVH